jgi:hypothetical protein
LHSFGATDPVGLAATVNAGLPCHYPKVCRRPILICSVDGRSRRALKHSGMIFPRAGGGFSANLMQYRLARRFSGKDMFAPLSATRYALVLPVQHGLHRFRVRLALSSRAAVRSSCGYCGH